MVVSQSAKLSTALFYAIGITSQDTNEVGDVPDRLWSTLVSMNDATGKNRLDALHKRGRRRFRSLFLEGIPKGYAVVVKGSFQTSYHPL